VIGRRVLITSPEMGDHGREGTVTGEAGTMGGWLVRLDGDALAWGWHRTRFVLLATPTESAMIAETVAAQRVKVVEHCTSTFPTFERRRDCDGSIRYMPVYAIRYPARFGL
jgi:hypothetical protein